MGISYLASASRSSASAAWACVPGACLPGTQAEVRGRGGPRGFVRMCNARPADRMARQCWVRFGDEPPTALYIAKFTALYRLVGPAVAHPATQAGFMGQSSYWDACSV